MTWFVTTLVVVLIGLTTAAVLGRVDGSLGAPTSSQGHEPLPERGLTDEDLDELRFDTALRGYRMAQVDRVVDRLRAELAALGAEVDRLRAEQPQPARLRPTPDHEEDPA